MDKNSTPQKQPRTAIRTTTAAQSYLRGTPESFHHLSAPSDLAMLKQYESLKIQVRQLQAKNRSLSAEMEQLLYEKNYSESKFIQKASLDDQAINEFSKEKNYQMELLQIKHDEEMSRLKRDGELRSDEFLREVKHKDYQIREKDEQNRYLELRNEELRRDYETLSLEFAKAREQNSANAQTITHHDFTIKKLEMLIEQADLQKAEMESEIRTLLDIEDEKSQTLATLETQLRSSEENQRRLMEKLTVLSQNFAELENHITVMKQQLISADETNLMLNQKLERDDLEIREKEKLILEQNDRENLLKTQLEEHQRREARREREVGELMTENEKLYREINVGRHRLHQFAIAYGVDI